MGRDEKLKRFFQGQKSRAGLRTLAWHCANALMIPWVLVDVAQVPHEEAELRLYRRGQEFSIRVGSSELMNSRVHGSEDVFGETVCTRIADRARPRVLIGGLGMGYTLMAALRVLGAQARVVVAEVVPAVVEWNHGPLGILAGHPLRDDRVIVREVDVAQALRSERGGFDAILLDVDNGPRALTRTGNEWLYGKAGLSAIFTALQPGGLLGVWSAGPDLAFSHRLSAAGFAVEETRVRARTVSGGARHTIWVATRPK